MPAQGLPCLKPAERNPKGRRRKTPVWVFLLLVKRNIRKRCPWCVAGRPGISCSIVKRAVGWQQLRSIFFGFFLSQKLRNARKVGRTQPQSVCAGCPEVRTLLSGLWPFALPHSCVFKATAQNTVLLCRSFCPECVGDAIFPHRWAAAFFPLSRFNLLWSDGTAVTGSSHLGRCIRAECLKKHTNTNTHRHEHTHRHTT